MSQRYAYARYITNLNYINSIILHTEWCGLRENYLATGCARIGKMNYEIIYRKDSKGNIKSIIYSYNGRYMPSKDVVYIDYVDE